MPQNLDSKYQFRILSPSGSLIADLSGLAFTRNIVLTRNRGHEATFSIDIYKLQQYAEEIGVQSNSLLATGQNELEILRGDRRIFRGKMQFDEGNLGDDTTITVRSQGTFLLLNYRYTAASVRYDDTDAGAIAMAAINYTQGLANGGLGITEGTIQATQNRDREYEYKNIMELLIQLTEVIGGFDLEMTPEKKFNVYDEQGVVRTEFEFTYPGNIKALRITRDATQLVNEVIARGQGFGESQLVVVEENTVSKAAYGLRQLVVDYPDISIEDTLRGHAQEILRLQSDPLKTMEIVMDGNQQPFLGSYWLGDRVPVKIFDHPIYENMNGRYRVDQIVLDIDEFDSETATITVSEKTV
jgi:hypothetical protein